MGMVIDATLGLESIREKGHEMFRVGGPIQMFIDSTVLKGVEPYVPFKIGTATKSGILHTRIGHGMLIWKTPYIRAIYYGRGIISRGPRKGKYTREYRYNRSFHPKAGKLWSERYKADHLTELTGMVRRKVGQSW